VAEGELDQADMELLLANFVRSFDAIAAALDDAAALDEDTTPIQRAGAVTRGMVKRYMEIDRKAVTYLVIALTGYLAEISKKTPREIHEELFREAPSDAWWKDRLATRDRRQEDE
jgi:hypothetical protein